MPNINTGRGSEERVRDQGFGLDAALLALGFLVLYTLTVFPYPPPVGDAADYTALIMGRVLGLSASLVANVTAASAMAGAIAMAYTLFRHLDLSRSVAVTAALILGEVIALFTFQSFTSAVLFLAGRPILTGGLYGLALLVTQLVLWIRSSVTYHGVHAAWAAWPALSGSLAIKRSRSWRVNFHSKGWATC